MVFRARSVYPLAEISAISVRFSDCRESSVHEKTVPSCLRARPWSYPADIARISVKLFTTCIGTTVPAFSGFVSRTFHATTVPSFLRAGIVLTLIRYCDNIDRSGKEGWIFSLTFHPLIYHVTTVPSFFSPRLPEMLVRPDWFAIIANCASGCSLENSGVNDDFHATTVPSSFRARFQYCDLVISTTPVKFEGDHRVQRFTPPSSHGTVLFYRIVHV